MRALVVGSLLLLWPAGTALAQPTVRIRSETRIELRTERRDDHVVIEGALRDDLGEPLSGRSVAFRTTPDDPAIPSRRSTLETDDDGAFRTRLDLTTGGHLLRATFAGDEMHERVEVERRLDLDRADVRLRVAVPDSGHLDLDRETHDIDVAATSTEGGSALRIDLLDELDRPLARGTTDASGSVSFTVRSVDLGAPGAGRIKARSRPDARRAEAQTEVPIVRFLRPHLSLAGSRTEARPGDDVRLVGGLTDSRGPLEGRAVGLFAGEEHLATVLTDRQGTFAADIALDASHEGRLEIVARYESDSPGLASSTSLPVFVSVAAARPTPWAWLLLPLAACSALLVLIARRAPKRPEKSVEAPKDKPLGVSLARRRTLRADREDVAGRVVDHRDDEPIPHARVALVDPTGAVAHETVADAGGAFGIDRVPASTFVLSVTADGYAESRARVQVPHRGEWSDAVVRLESLRARVLAPYRAVAAEILPSPRHWGTWTQREVLDRARSAGRGGPELAELTERVEEAYYGATPPTDRDVVEIEARADVTLAALRSASGRGQPGSG